MIRAIPNSDGTFLLLDGYKPSEKTYYIKEKIKQAGGKWNLKSKHWIISEDAIEKIGVERVWWAKLDDGSECLVTANEIKEGKHHYKSDGYDVKIIEVLK